MKAPLFIVTVCAVVLSFGVCSTAVEATEYFAAINHPNASDSNDGLTLSEPFITLGRGAQMLSPGDTLTIGEGVYREKLQVTVDGTAGDPIIVRALPGDEGLVWIRGSDLVTSWSDDGQGIWSVPWTPLPLLDYPPSYQADEYAMRREIVFFNDGQLEQVLSAAELTEGSFWMDDAAGRLRVCIAGDPNAGEVEVSVREFGVQARGRSNVAVHGIRVEHVSPALWVGALSLGNYGTIEDCRVEFNNGIGIALESNAVIIRTAANNNGQIGINLAGSSNSLIESSETNYNSWRYGPGWAAGGIKIVSVGTSSDNRIVRHVARFNNGPGIFIDTVADGNIIEASVMEGNVGAEVFIEAGIGPNWVINNLILNTNNGEFGVESIRLLVSRDTYVYNNTVVNEGGSGIFITGVERYSGPYHNYCANTYVYNNIFDLGAGPRVIDLGVGGLSSTPENLASHHFDNNLYRAADPLAWWQGPYTLAEWQTVRGEDLNSFAADPLFTSPELDDYSLQGVSPAVDAGQDFSEVFEDISGTPRPFGLATDIGAYEWVGDGFIFYSGFETGDLSEWVEVAR